ncbi:MAG: hypothetical protein OXH00_03685 [Candidatus Poribacteria bacterium]|nr:hypothetical protein [Candidatus Poribacteria bacterium]
MDNLKQQHKKLNKRGKGFDMGFKEFAKKMENKLKLMGIERPRHGPRISAPAHSRDMIYSHSSSSVQQKNN